MIRPFPSFQRVRMTFLQDETCAPILQSKPAAFGNSSGSKSSVIALNITAGITPLVCHSKVTGIRRIDWFSLSSRSFIVRWEGVLHAYMHNVSVCALWIEKVCSRGKVFLAQQLVDGNRVEGRVIDIISTISECEP